MLGWLTQGGARSSLYPGLDSVTPSEFLACRVSGTFNSFREAACIGLAVLAPARESLRQPSRVGMQPGRSNTQGVDRARGQREGRRPERPANH